MALTAYADADHAGCQDTRRNYQLADIFTKALPREQFEFLLPRFDTMADVNVNAPADQAPIMAPPTCTDDQILPHIRWTSGFERLRAPVLQIIWGVVNRAHIDYTERIWEEFIQSIHTFIEDKKNLAQHTHKKKKATLIVILSIRFTNLIIYYLQRKHKFHPRPDSPLHFPNKELVLGYLKFSAKGTKREVFRMPIPGNLITADIQARRSKPGLVTKRCKPTSSLRSVDESVTEGIPEKEPRFNDEEADVQRELEESLKSIYDAPRGPLDLLTLQTPKKKSHTDQFIFQRRTSTSTGSSGHDESSSLYAELGMTDTEVESDEDVPGIDAGVQDEGQARPNPGEAAASQPLSCPVVHAGPNLEHMDLEATDVSTQPHPKQMDEGFTATAYPKVQENIKLTVEEHVILKEPASSTGTLSSLQHLAKDVSFGNLFFNDKPLEADKKKTTAETEAESMVSVSIQQDTSAIPPMTTSVINLTSRPESPNVHRPLQNGNQNHNNNNNSSIATSTTIKHHKFHVDEVQCTKKEVKEHDSPKTPPGSPPHQPPPPPPLVGPFGTSGPPGASRSSQVPPPPPLPLSTNQEGQSHGSATPSSLKTAASVEYKAWKTTDTRLRLSVSSTPEDLQIDDDIAPNVQIHSFDDEYIRNAHIPKVNLRQDWWKPLKEDRPATPEPAWSIPSSDLPVPKNNWASALASTFSPPLEDSLLA
nr:hypothetical protein [Tanacetum cinerariifolium]